MNRSIKSASLIAFMMIVSKVLGVIREVLLAKEFGTSYIVDAYSIAVSVPTILFSVYASGFANSYIPMYSRVSKKIKNDFFSNTITILTLFSVFMMGASIIFSDSITRVIAPGFSGYAFYTTSGFIRIIVTVLPPLTVFNIFSAQAQVHEDFIFANFCDFIIVNILVIVSILISDANNPQVLVVGYVLAFVVATIMLVINVVKKGEAKYRWIFSPRDYAFTELTRLSIPIGLSLLVNQINSTVDKVFSSSLGEGITSALSYANRIQLIPYSLAVSVVLTICYPKVSNAFARREFKDGYFYMEKSIMIALLIGIPVTAYFCFFSKDIVRVLFERGAFNEKSTLITAECLACYAVGVPFYSMREVLSKVLAANLKQKIILRNTVISVLCNIGLDFFLVDSIGYVGLPLATSISGVLAWLLMAWDVHRISEKSFLNITYIAKDTLRILLCSFASVGLCKLIFEFVQHGFNHTIAFMFAFILSLIFFVGACYICKVAIVSWVYGMLPKHLKMMEKK